MRNENISQYFRNQEVDHEDFQLTVSLGHILVHTEDLTAVTYEEENGLKDFLAYLVRLGWEEVLDEGLLIGAQKDKASIRLGIGGQVNWQYKGFMAIRELEQAYLGFIEGLFDELKRRGQILLSVGHQPMSKAADIPAVPLKKYECIMNAAEDNADLQDYYKAACTSSVSFQYAHIDNFEKRFQAALIIYPALAALFDNTPWADGKEVAGPLYNINHILNADSNLYHLEHGLNEEFKYEEYADVIMQAPIFYTEKDGEIICTGKEAMEDVFKDSDADEKSVIQAINQALPMISVTENGITVQNIDAIPYPLNMSYVALLKSLLYTPDHMTAVHKMLEEVKEPKLIESREEWRKKGLEAGIGEGTYFDMVKDLFFMVNLTVEPTEQHYLQPFSPIIFKGIETREVTNRQIKNMLD